MQKNLVHIPETIIYIYIYVCVCVCIYVCVCVYIYTYIYIYIYVCVCMCIYIYIYMCVYTYIYIYIYICVCVCINKYIYVYVYMSVCEYIYIHTSANWNINLINILWNKNYCLLTKLIYLKFPKILLPVSAAESLIYLPIYYCLCDMKCLKNNSPIFSANNCTIEWIKLAFLHRKPYHLKSTNYFLVY